MNDDQGLKSKDSDDSKHLREDATDSKSKQGQLLPQTSGASKAKGSDDSLDFDQRHIIKQEGSKTLAQHLKQKPKYTVSSSLGVWKSVDPKKLPHSSIDSLPAYKSTFASKSGLQISHGESKLTRKIEQQLFELEVRKRDLFIAAPSNQMLPDLTDKQLRKLDRRAQRNDRSKFSQFRLVYNRSLRSQFSLEGSQQAELDDKTLKNIFDAARKRNLVSKPIPIKKIQVSTVDLRSPNEKLREQLLGFVDCKESMARFLEKLGDPRYAEVPAICSAHHYLRSPAQKAILADYLLEHVKQFSRYLPGDLSEVSNYLETLQLVAGEKLQNNDCCFVVYQGRLATQGKVFTQGGSFGFEVLHQLPEVSLVAEASSTVLIAPASRIRDYFEVGLRH